MTPISAMRVMNGGGSAKTVDDVRKLSKSAVTDIVISMVADERAGNPEPTFWTHPDGQSSYNAVGLRSAGIKYYKQNLPRMRDKAHAAGKRLVANITSTKSAGDWSVLAALAAQYCDGVEANLGCPNLWFDGVQKPVVAHDGEATHKAIQLINREIPRDMELIVKLSPFEYPQSDPKVCEVAQALRESNRAMILNIGNTVTVDSPYHEGKRQISMPKCGMSGPAMRRYTMALLMRMNQLLPEYPKVGTGGIVDGVSLLDYQRLGVIGWQSTTHYMNFGEKVFGEIMADAMDIQERSAA